MTAERMLVVWLPDWPITAAGLDEDVPAVIKDSQMIYACSSGARKLGIKRHQRLRDAQAHCPGLAIVERDDVRDARMFEPIVDAVTNLSPRVEILRAGLCATPTLGASRYFGGDEALVKKVRDALCEVGVHARTGVADGRFAAVIAARQNKIVAPGEAPYFLADKRIDELDRPDLVGTLRRLGIKTLGDFAALPAGQVADRFGPEGRHAHQLASGKDPAPLQMRSGLVDLQVEKEIEPPALLADQVAFVAKVAADELMVLLVEVGLACTLVEVEIETENAELRRRAWRHQYFFDSTSVVDRVRWQLNGWTTAGENMPTSPVTKIRLLAAEVVPDTGKQFAFWGGETQADARASRALARVQAVLGFEAVTTPQLIGGRDYESQVRLIPWGEPREVGSKTEPWPGRLPLPAPAVLNRRPMSMAVLDSELRAVVVNKRGLLSGDPCWLTLDGDPRTKRMQVVGWSAPWLFDERWWRANAKRCVRMQFLTEDGTALLGLFEAGTWKWEATYD